jgi:hypothetical protein
MRSASPTLDLAPTHLGFGTTRKTGRAGRRRPPPPWTARGPEPRLTDEPLVSGVAAWLHGNYGCVVTAVPR